MNCMGVVNEESAMEIEINRIHAFKDHPFKVLDDEKMADLSRECKDLRGIDTGFSYGLMVENGYEMNLRSSKDARSSYSWLGNNSCNCKRIYPMMDAVIANGRC